MIKIEKGTDTKVVTRGAYKSFYKPLGYTIVNNERPIKTSVLYKSEKTNDNKEVNKDTTTKTIKDDSKRK